ncbi:MAG: hypothetical protein QXM31_00335 [Candidatus Woesearchaeota archaeon]
MEYRHKKNCIEKRALAAAKKLEKIPEPTKEEIAGIYKETVEEARRLNKILKPEWFVKDIDKPAKKAKIPSTLPKRRRKK